MGRGSVSKRKWLLIAAVILIVVVAVPVLFDFSSGSFVFRFGRNPVEEYASSKGLPKDLVNILKPLGVNGTMEHSTKTMINELSELGNYTSSPVVHSVVANVTADGNVNGTDLEMIQDIDKDCILNPLEMTFHTDPTSMYTSNTTLDDFNAIYTYGVDPNNQTAVKMVLDKSIPNVQVRHWGSDDGGKDVYSNRIELTLRDPLIKKLAEKSEIRWEGDRGRLFVDDSPLWSSEGRENVTRTADQPSYFFTHGRKGNCVEVCDAGVPIMKLMGYDKIKEVGVKIKGTGEGHAVAEVYLEGKGIYVLSMDKLFPREEFYTGYEITDSDYDPNWYIK